MLQLRSIDEGFTISTTDVVVKYSERSGAMIEADVKRNRSEAIADEYFSLILTFDLVAEMKCVSVNFSEFQYGNYEIIEDSISLEQEHQKNDSGFYIVTDSIWQKEMAPLYDPKNRFKLRHFIICGYDSYIELLASEYRVMIKEKNQ